MRLRSAPATRYSMLQYRVLTLRFLRFSYLFSKAFPTGILRLYSGFHEVFLRISNAKFQECYIPVLGLIDSPERESSNFQQKGVGGRARSFSLFSNKMSSCLSLAHFLFKSSFWKKKGNRGILGFRVLRIQESRVRDYVGLPRNEKPFKNAAKAREG